MKHLGEWKGMSSSLHTQLVSCVWHFAKTEQDIILQRQNKVLSSQSYFSSSHVWMWELDYIKAERWRIDAFELWCWRKLQSPLDCKEIQPVHPKGNQSWMIIGRIDAEAETPILWPPAGKNWLIGKDPDAGRDWRQLGKGMAEDGMVGWHRRLDGHELEQALWVGDGQGNLAFCSPWDCKE